MDKDAIKLAIAQLQSHLRISRVLEAPHALFRWILKKVTDITFCAPSTFTSTSTTTATTGTTAISIVSTVATSTPRGALAQLQSI